MAAEGFGAPIGMTGTQAYGAAGGLGGRGHTQRHGVYQHQYQPPHYNHPMPVPAFVNGSWAGPAGPNDCQTCRRNTIRKYPEHYCQWERCCLKFADEGTLLGKDFDHLPVCHALCWTLEQKRLEERARRQGVWPQAAHRVPMCHRQCYMTACSREQDPDGEDVEVVPPNRTISERLHIPKIEHEMGWDDGTDGWERLKSLAKLILL